MVIATEGRWVGICYSWTISINSGPFWIFCNWGDEMEEHQPNKNADIGGGCVHKGAWVLVMEPTAL